MLISGFVDGKLIYILEFPFGTKSFIDKLQKQLDKRFPDGDKKGEFLRSANFDYRHYINSKECQINFLLPKIELINFKEYINKKFLEILIDKTQ